MAKANHQAQRARALDLLSKEVGYVRKPHGGRLRVALAFPNTYFVGMSNLGFQTVYKLFNAEPGIVCERFFLPPKSELAAQMAAGSPLITLESQTPVRDFDIVAFSVSFEWDYTNVLTLLRLAGIPVRSDERTHHDPLVLIGGGGGYLKPAGGIVKVSAMHTDLLATLAEAMGAPVTSFGSVSAKPIAELKA